MTSIGYNILSAMESQGLTQKSLAEKAGISQSSLSAIIHGTTPKPSTLTAISVALGLATEKLSEKTTQEVNECPRCGSKNIVEWTNHANGRTRLRCAYCEADTEEQQSRAEALRIFHSFQKVAERRAHSDVYVLGLDELLDSSCADADDVRPVWFENRGLFIVPALLQYGIAERENDTVKVLWFGKITPNSYMLNLYNKAWRCWNRRATAEHSEAVGWDDSLGHAVLRP